MKANIEKLNTPLSIDQVDFRVQSLRKNAKGEVYAIILAYKDARVDMNRLDEVFGVFGWQKKFELINGNLFCSVGVYDQETSQWIWKSDVGTESNTEKEKGQASDAFKRACFNLGIGRELYDYPFMYILLKENEYYESGGKLTSKINFNQWRWDSVFKDAKLVHLVGFDKSNVKRFEYGKL